MESTKERVRGRKDRVRGLTHMLLKPKKKKGERIKQKQYLMR